MMVFRQFVYLLLLLLLNVSIVTSVIPDYTPEQASAFLHDYDPYEEGDPRIEEEVEVVEEDDDEGDDEDRSVYIDDNQTYDPSPPNVFPADMKQQRWANAAFAFVKSIDCKDSFFTTGKECKSMQRLRKTDMTIYLADPTTDGRLEAVLPDDDLAGGDLGHDAVIVVDPYPAANFGHLVIVFYLDLDTEEAMCHQMGGQMLAGGECMYLATKNRCKNLLERRTRRRNFARRCEINFLPHVRLVGGDEVGPLEQRLTCRENIPGWARCPQLRALNETADLICNPMRDNTKRCETTHERVHTSCRVMEICDQAVLISGGWNRWSHRLHHRQNVVDMYYMLKNHGFLDRNIKVFFANGDYGIQKGEGLKTHDVYPAALKPALRSHIQKLCATPHCADSLLLYMNSPSRSDGTSLLWDLDGDGYASEAEVYTQEELLGDIANCQAKQLNLVVDQSYAGEIARAIRRSKNHRNVAVFAGAKDNEYSSGDEFTQIWAQTNHTQKCAKQVFRDAKKEVRYSTPDLQEGEDVANVNIFGAPCDVMPPFTQKELEQNYLGCQNLPSALWVMKILSSGLNIDTLDLLQNPSADASRKTSGL